jgi:hypothetical protein
MGIFQNKVFPSAPEGYGLAYCANWKQVEFNDQKILFWEWVVKGKIPSPRYPYFLAEIGDFGLK